MEKISWVTVVILNEIWRIIVQKNMVMFSIWRKRNEEILWEIFLIPFIKDYLASMIDGEIFLTRLYSHT